MHAYDWGIVRCEIKQYFPLKATVVFKQAPQTSCPQDLVRSSCEARDIQQKDYFMNMESMFTKIVTHEKLLLYTN